MKASSTAAEKSINPTDTKSVTPPLKQLQESIERNTTSGPIQEITVPLPASVGIRVKLLFLHGMGSWSTGFELQSLNHYVENRDKKFLSLPEPIDDINASNAVAETLAEAVHQAADEAAFYLTTSDDWNKLECAKEAAAALDAWQEEMLQETEPGEEVVLSESIFDGAEDLQPGPMEPFVADCLRGIDRDLAEIRANAIPAWMREARQVMLQSVLDAMGIFMDTISAGPHTSVAPMSTAKFLGTKPINENADVSKTTTDKPVIHMSEPTQTGADESWRSVLLEALKGIPAKAMEILKGNRIFTAGEYVDLKDKGIMHGGAKLTEARVKKVEAAIAEHMDYLSTHPPVGKPIVPAPEIHTGSSVAEVTATNKEHLQAVMQEAATVDPDPTVTTPLPSQIPLFDDLVEEL